MVDIQLFKKRFKKKIKNKYGSIGNFAEAIKGLDDPENGKTLNVSLPTIYRWTATSNESLPQENQREAICKILDVSSTYLFPPPQIVLDANYYIGYLEGSLLGSYSHHINNLKNDKSVKIENAIIEDDDGENGIATKFWRTIYLYKNEDLVHKINKIWKFSTTRTSLETLIFDMLLSDELSDNQLYKEYLVELAILLVHYMGGAIELWEQRIKLAKKARSAAKDLANDLPPQEGRSKRFKTAYYLLSIDALAWMYMRTSRAEEAIGILEKILVEIETDFIERPNTKALCLIFLARAYLLIENINIDEASKKLADVDVKKITNHLVRIRFLMIQGDIFIKTDSVMAAISVYEEAIAIQAQLGIDFNSSGLSYRIGKAYVDEAKNLPTESSEKTVYLEKAKKIFIDIDEVERDSIDKYYALCGLAQITALEESYKEALKKAEEVRKMYWERFERIEHTDKRPHLLLNYIDDFIKELRVLTDN